MDDLIEVAIRTAYTKSCHGDFEAVENVDFLRESGQIGFWVHQCCLEAILHNLKDSYKTTEQEVYIWFRENYKNVLGSEYEIVKRENDPQHKPDFWIKHKEQYIPVECKLNGFTAKSLKQLQRYMNFYGAYFGIAVGFECDIELPDNIIFVKHEVKNTTFSKRKGA